MPLYDIVWVSLSIKHLAKGVFIGCLLPGGKIVYRISTMANIE